MDNHWNLSPAAESAEIAKLKPKYELFINGNWQEPKSKKYFKTINPANEAMLAKVAEAGSEDVDAALRQLKRHSNRGISFQVRNEGNTYIVSHG